MAGATDVSDLLRAFLMDTWNSVILGADEIDPSQFSCIFKIELLIRPLLLLLQLGILSHSLPEPLALDVLSWM